jgi:hypothetical protein
LTNNNYWQTPGNQDGNDELLEFLDNVIITKTKVLLPQSYKP